MDWLRRFMQGRYGVDALTWGLFGLSLVLSLLSGMVRDRGILQICSYLVTALYFYRMLSRDYHKRSAENQRFLQFAGPLCGNLAAWWQRMQQSSTYIHLKCPRCRQPIRVPRHRGKICITCPGCGNEFVKKT